jgi:cell wall-associated NlpC family hydrolase
VQAVRIAMQYLGVPYRWGGADPIGGFDCSGLAMYVYAQLGIQLTHYTGSQFYEGARVPPSALLPGDLLFFEPSARGPQHEGIYIGDGQFIQAPHTGDVVKISSLSEPGYAFGFVGAVRPWGA